MNKFDLISIIISTFRDRCYKKEDKVYKVIGICTRRLDNNKKCSGIIDNRELILPSATLIFVCYSKKRDHKELSCRNIEKAIWITTE